MVRSLPAQFGLICGIVAAPLLAAPAAAQEGMFFKDLLGNVGVIPKSKDPIAYRERPGLVVPPKAQLRAPGTARAAAANPAWPNDPDVAAKRRAAADDAVPVTWSEKRRMSDNNNLRLTPQEIQAGRIARDAAPDPASHRGDSARDVLYLSPDELRAKAKRDEPDDGPQPVRRALTDPPSDVRKWAGGKAIRGDFQPIVDQQALDANPMTWLTKRFRSDDDE